MGVGRGGEKEKGKKEGEKKEKEKATDRLTRAGELSLDRFPIPSYRRVPTCLRHCLLDDGRYPPRSLSEERGPAPPRAVAQELGRGPSQKRACGWICGPMVRGLCPLEGGVVKDRVGRVDVEPPWR